MAWISTSDSSHGSLFSWSSCPCCKFERFFCPSADTFSPSAITFPSQSGCLSGQGLCWLLYSSSLSQVPPKTLAREGLETLLLRRVCSGWADGKEQGHRASHQCGKSPGFEGKEVTGRALVSHGNVCLTPPAPAHPWQAAGPGSCSGRQFGIQELLTRG